MTDRAFARMSNQSTCLFMKLRTAVTVQRAKKWLKHTFFAHFARSKGYKLPIMREYTQSIYTTDFNILQEEFVSFGQIFFTILYATFFVPKMQNIGYIALFQTQEL